ncbi:MAG: TraB/GumN family protein [Firmicutes bacterium]|nr:TraB/GumN family protein [Erysipelotrichaceae bacterium]MDD6524753.1 TraB/GumN family protein [Bacillota bacterium]MDD7228428.1 TraB/GumN family protein [Bacillota bacterium]MDY5997752.1 TraB/GumN family protein [Erysipelotrichaceae bacterium]
MEILHINDKEIYILGTAHVSKISKEEVLKTIDENAFDTICIELDQRRYNSLNNPKKWEETNIIDVIKKKQTGFLLANLILSSYQKRVASKINSQSGIEMITAIKEAKEKNIHLELIDRDIQTTFSRIYQKHNLWQKAKLIVSLISAIFDDEEINDKDIEALKQEDILDMALKDIEKAFPIVSEVLIDERNKILAQNIKKAPGKKILAIVGAAHIPGILKYINEDIDITEINNKVIKPKSSKIKGWIIPALIISMIAITCFKNFDQAKNQMLVWLIVNGGLSALGALIAFAHPLSVITAFIAAPITSLNPLLAAGWFAGIMEAYLRKPKVSDLQNIDEAANSLKGLYQNRFTHVLIVVILANIGSSIGTFIAGLDIFKSFISIFN